MSSSGACFDTIVVGLGASGTVAATTLARAGRRVLALEAAGEIGGRVSTVRFGDGLVELGAEWIHGERRSDLFDIATRHRIALAKQTVHKTPMRSDGTAVPIELFDELMDYSFEVVDEDKNASSFGEFLANKLKAYIEQHHPDVYKDKDFVEEFLHFRNLVNNNYDAANEWTDVNVESQYHGLKGHQHWSWHRYGYKTLFDLLLNKHNSDVGLPNLRIELNSEVSSISWPTDPSHLVHVSCTDGRKYSARSVIVTVSLGVLKERHSTLFTPALPKDKIDAINLVQMGVMDKIILSFSHVWWPLDRFFFAFVWKGDDRRRVSETDYWVTRIFGASRPMGTDNCLTLWTSGEVAKQVETMPEDEVKEKLVELLQRFVGDYAKVGVPQPTNMIRSTWYSNPYTRGSYTYDPATRDGGAPVTPRELSDARMMLAPPLRDAGGAPRVLFCGEATHAQQYSTVHGAMHTGLREANSLLPTSKI